ncbi:8952_t:CDS:2, partial [Funneliformis geosporum]
MTKQIMILLITSLRESFFKQEHVIQQNEVLQEAMKELNKSKELAHFKMQKRLLVRDSREIDPDSQPKKWELPWTQELQYENSTKIMPISLSTLDYFQDDKARLHEPDKQVDLRNICKLL